MTEQKKVAEAIDWGIRDGYIDVATAPAERPEQTALTEGLLSHKRNCPAWKDMHGYDVNGEDCTCGLRWRKEILNLQIALNSQIEITNNERAIKERAEATIAELTGLLERFRDSLQTQIPKMLHINHDELLELVREIPARATGKES